jgi:hypothetical protein
MPERLPRIWNNGIVGGWFLSRRLSEPEAQNPLFYYSIIFTP